MNSDSDKESSDSSRANLDSGTDNEYDVSDDETSVDTTPLKNTPLKNTPLKNKDGIDCQRKKRTTRYPLFSSDDEGHSIGVLKKKKYLNHHDDDSGTSSEDELFSYKKRKRSPRKLLHNSYLLDTSTDEDENSMLNEIEVHQQQYQDDESVVCSSSIYDSDQEIQLDIEHHVDGQSSSQCSESNVESGTCSSSDEQSSSDESRSDDVLDASRDENSKNIFDGIICENSNLTRGASYVLILQFSRKYKLSRKAQNDLLTLIRLHCPDDVKDVIPKTYKELLKRTLPGISTLKKTRLCRVCKETLEDNAVACQKGHRVANRNPTKDEAFFINIPLEPQLKILIEENTSDILASCERQRLECSKESATYKDITDGSSYKDFYKTIHDEDPEGTSHHISLMLSTDGAPVFKSTNSSIWPLYVVILEIPPNKRYSIKNVLLLGLWYGPQKPDINAFLQTTLTTISKLAEDGLECTAGGDFLTFKVHLHCCICDLPGKALILLHKLFNGKFGCSICFHPGLRLPIRGNVRVYPFSAKYTRRTARETRFHALVAEASGASVFGLKGFSILLNHMSIPDGCPIDYMHCILQGTGKWILTAMINSSNKDKPFYLSPASQRKVNTSIESIAVPHDMERKPRTLDNLKRWKATEIQHFLLYFGLPVLKGVLNPEYFHHLALLSSALWIFLKNEITRDEIEFAGIVIKSFCRLMKQYYGVRSETINAHSLSHLEQQVHIMGPLWTHSSFAFKAMIAHLLTAFKGTRGVADQMANNYLVERQIYPLTHQLQESDAGEEVKHFSKSLSLSKPRLKWSQQERSAVSFAEPTQLKSMSAEEVNAVNALLAVCNLSPVHVDINEKYNYAERIEMNGNVFHSRSYKRAGKSCSSIVQLRSLDQSEYFYGEVQTYIRVKSLPIAIVKLYSQVVTSICSVNITPPSDPSVLAYASAKLLGSNHIPMSGPLEPELFAIKCTSITCKCILVKVNEPFIFAYVTPVTDFNCK